MVKKYRVELTAEEQEELKALVSRGRAAAYKQTHARILLLSDENQAQGPMMDQEIARSLKVGTATVERVRRRCVEEGVAAALGRKEQLNRRRKKLDGQGEAHPVSSTGQAMEDVLEVYHRSYEDNDMKTRKFWCAWTRPANNWWGRPGNPVRRGLVQSWPTIMNTSATG